MKMFKITGLNELNRKLQDLAKKAQALDGTHNVPISELLTPAFVLKQTRFANADEMFNASGFKIETEQDFAAIPDDKWDEFIRAVSSFSDWQAMLRAASKEWAAKKLGI
jgi:hypothetical protein